MNLFSIAGLTCAITCAALASIAFIFGKNKLHRTLAFFNIAVGIWGLGCFLAGVARTDQSAVLGWRVGFLGGFWIGPIFLILVFFACRVWRKNIFIFGIVQAVFFDVMNVI